MDSAATQTETKDILRPQFNIDLLRSRREGGRPTFPDSAALSEALDFAFQPIVNVHTGTCYGVEALLRGYRDLGYDNIFDFFDSAYAANQLRRADLDLRHLAISKFARFDEGRGLKLFYNLDNRIIDAETYMPGMTSRILEHHGLLPTSLCLEISERQEIGNQPDIERILGLYNTQSYRMAIDDFGTGHSGLKLLKLYQPDFIKIDRFFISGITADTKKQLMVSTIVNMAHVLGISVIAEGVETETEYLVCKNLGCDLIQGFFVAMPTVELDELQHSYEAIKILNAKDRRRPESDQDLIVSQMVRMEPLKINTPMNEVFKAFRKNKQTTFFPVIDESGQPLGLVRERDLKDYTYSPFGKELISNKSCGKQLRDFITEAPVANIQATSEKILETYALSPNQEGVLIVSDMVFVGFLSAASLLMVLNEKKVAKARDQNPLTQLPGNASIMAYVIDHLERRRLEENRREVVFVYFDFDNFKPFNDTYGFRQGDRALSLFSDLMKKHLPNHGVFLGHIGGDDFFVGFEGLPLEVAERAIRKVCGLFCEQIESFYAPEAIEAGGIVARDRAGVMRRFPPMSVSASVLLLPPQSSGRASADEIAETISQMKKNAKASDEGICLASLV